MNRPNEGTRFVHLDMVRGLAALLVCAAHLRNIEFVPYFLLEPKPSWPHRVFFLLTAQGHAAVIVFFVLSGFFVAGSVAIDFENAKWSWRRFALRRLSRLYVVLLPALVLTFFWDQWAFQNAAKIDLGVHSFYALCINLVYGQSIFGPFFGSNYPLWSVAYEFWYYLMFPLLFIAVFDRGQIRGRLFCFALFLTCIAFLPGKVLIGGLVWLTGYGAFAASHDQRFSSVSSHGAVFILALIGLIAGVGIETLGRQGNMTGDFTDITFQDLFLGLSFSMMLPWLIRMQPRVAWYRNVAVGLSDISYTLYAVHLPLIGFLSCTIFRYKEAVPSMTSYMCFVGCLGVVLLYALAVWWLFESRTGKVRKFLEARFLKRRAT